MENGVLENTSAVLLKIDERRMQQFAALYKGTFLDASFSTDDLSGFSVRKLSGQPEAQFVRVEKNELPPRGEPNRLPFSGASCMSSIYMRVRPQKATVFATNAASAPDSPTHSSESWSPECLFSKKDLVNYCVTSGVEKVLLGQREKQILTKENCQEALRGNAPQRRRSADWFP